MRLPLLLLAAVLAPAEPSRAAEPEPVPFLKLELNAAPFRGADPAATRVRVDAFVAGLGRPLDSYQDNDALLAVTVKAAIEEAGGALAAVQRSLRRLRFFRALKGLGLGETDARGDDWQIVLRPHLYPENVRARLAALPEKSDIAYYENKAMTGTIWLQLSIGGLKDAEGFARRVAREHPREIRSAAIMIAVPVAKITTGAR